MDYSLLVGVYNIEQAKRELQSKRGSVDAAAAATASRTASVSAGTPGFGVGPGTASAPASVVHARLNVSKSAAVPGPFPAPVPAFAPGYVQHNQNQNAAHAGYAYAGDDPAVAQLRRGSVDAVLRAAESNTSSSRTITSPSSPHHAHSSLISYLSLIFRSLISSLYT